MSDIETKYLLDLEGVKTLYKEIMNDVDGKTINVNSLDELADADLQNVNMVVLTYD